jgi:hypothetical protein
VAQQVNYNHLSSQYYSKIVFEVLSNAEDEMHDDIHWDDSKHIGQCAPSSANESATEGSVFA